MPLPSRVEAVRADECAEGGQRRVPLPERPDVGSMAALQHDPPEERPLDGAHHEAVRRRVDEQVRHLLVVVRPDRVGRLTASDVHEEEDLPDVGAGVVDDRRDVGELVDVARHDRGVDLHLQSSGDQRTDRRERPVEVAGDAPHAVVGGRHRTIEADRHRADADLDHARDRIGREHRRDRRRHRHREAELTCVPGQVEHVRAEQAVAAGEHQDRVGSAELGDLLDQPPTLVVVELTGERSRRGRRPAVVARELAGTGDLPEDEERARREVERGAPVTGGSHHVHDRQCPRPDRATPTVEGLDLIR